MTIIGVYYQRQEADANVYRMNFVELCNLKSMSLHRSDVFGREEQLQTMSPDNVHERGSCSPSGEG